MSEPIRRGRPPKPAPRWQDTLTMRQVRLYILEKGRETGRRISIATISHAMATGALPCAADLLRHDRYGRPLMVTTRADVDAWLDGTLQPLQVRDLLSA